MLANQINTGMFPTTARTAAYMSRRTADSFKRIRMVSTAPITKASPRSRVTVDSPKATATSRSDHIAGRSKKVASAWSPRSTRKKNSGSDSTVPCSGNESPAKITAKAIDPSRATPRRWERNPKRNTFAEKSTTPRTLAQVRTELPAMLSSIE